MSVILDINGQDFAYPEVGDEDWGPDATDWAVAVTSGMLQKAGGLFLLLDDVDFGTNFGLISKYYTSRTVNAAESGAVRLANLDEVAWRNAADSADLGLTVNASDELQFNGSAIGNFVTVSDSATIDLTLLAGDLSAAIKALSITDAYISASAAIAVTKLAALTASRAVVSDASGFLASATTTAIEIGYVNGVTSAIQTQLNAKQASGNYLTALTGDVTATGPGSVAATLATVNSNVGSFGATTAIPSFTVNAKGLITAAATNAVVAPAGTLTGTTLASNVVTSSLTAVGTIATGVWNGTNIALASGGTNANLTAAAGAVVYSTGSAMAISAAGSSGQVLTSGGTGAPTWTSSLTNPMTTAGDVIVGGVAGAPARLALGTAGKVLRTDGTNLTYQYPTPVIQTKTSAYTADINDDVIYVSGTFIQTFPTAVGVTGKIFQVVFTSFTTGAVTLATTSAQTIGGRASSAIILRQYNDFVRIQSDGANWQILAKKETEVVTATGTALLFSTVGANNYANMTGNSVSLTAGQWRISYFYMIGPSASSVNLFLSQGSGLYAANGANSASVPTALTGVTGNAAMPATSGTDIIGTSGPYIHTATNSVIFTTSTTQSVFSVPKISFGTASTGTINTAIIAERIW